MLGVDRLEPATRAGRTKRIRGYVRQLLRGDKVETASLITMNV